jgi:probable phosphoglycerate mutase
VYEAPDRRRIYLLRHAEAAYIRDDGRVTDDPRTVPLTAAGRVQARKQAAILASVEFDRAVCSGLPRTVETARLILALRDEPELEIEPALEEIQGGDRTHPIDDMAAWLNHVANPWAGADEPEARFLGGEKFSDFADRLVPAFERIIEDTSWRSLLLVLHGAVNRMLLNHVMGVSWHSNASIEQDNCCINVIDVDAPRDDHPRRYLIRAINLTGYDLNKSSLHLTTMEQAALRIAAELGD